MRKIAQGSWNEIILPLEAENGNYSLLAEVQVSWLEIIQ